jgi:hypothetical protein
MAGAPLSFGASSFKNLTLNTGVIGFLVCLKHQMGTISVPMRQSLPGSSLT